MAEAWAAGRRVYVEDPRGNDIHLRVTWHPDSAQFVVSHWQGSVCLAATRMPASAAPAVITLLAQGVGDAMRDEAPIEALGPDRRSWRDRWSSARSFVRGAVARRSA